MGYRVENGSAIVTEGLPTEFMRRVFDSLPRMDQRRWAGIYLLGLTNVPGRKSLRNIADYVGIGCGVQSLQQFVNQSPWRWEPVQRAVAEFVEEHEPTVAWSVGHAVIPKRGDHSVGVERRFITAEGRTVNCQVGTGLYLMSDAASVPVNWRLLLSEKWTQPGERRQRARIPDWVTPRSERQLVTDMVTQLAEDWGLRRRPVLVNQSHEVNPTPLLAEFEEHGIGYVVEVPASFGVITGDREAGWRDRRVMSIRDCVNARGLERSQVSTMWDQPDRAGAEPAMIFTTLVRLALPGIRPQVPVLRVIARRSTGQADRFWVTNMTDCPMPTLIDLIRRKTRSELSLELATDEYGVRDFEGRSFRGWHHHMTLVSAAHAARLVAAEEPGSQFRLPMVPKTCAADTMVMW